MVLSSHSPTDQIILPPSIFSRMFVITKLLSLFDCVYSIPHFYQKGNRKNEINLRENAGLADIAPTLLQLLNLPIPREMTGKSLIQEIELKGYNKVVQHV